MAMVGEDRGWREKDLAKTAGGGAERKFESEV